jgi:hypothetical protein
MVATTSQCCELISTMMSLLPRCLHFGTRGVAQDVEVGCHKLLFLSQLKLMKLLVTSSLLTLLRRTSAFPLVTQHAAVRMSSTLSAKPFAVVVQAEIQPDRVEEFLKLIEENAINTRKEPGCIRFGKLCIQVFIIFGLG